MRKVLSLTQEESLRATDRGTANRIPSVTTHNPHNTLIAEWANRHWHFLQSKERLARIFHEPALIADRRPKSLRDTLLSAKLRSRTPGEGISTTSGCGCYNKPKCSWFTRINNTSTFTGNQPTLTMTSPLQLSSKWNVLIWLLNKNRITPQNGKYFGKVGYKLCSLPDWINLETRI